MSLAVVVLLGLIAICGGHRFLLTLRSASVHHMSAARVTMNVVQGGRTSSAASRTHLYVLVHGLGGSPDDLTYLRQSIERKGGPGTYVHLAQGNKGNTRDGVRAGGTRLANEIDAIVKGNPTLKRISIVGNSLGGLYSRYAIRELFNETDGSIAGLKPVTFMTIASPMLGIRRFTYVPVPVPFHPLAGLFVGKTGEDLFLRHTPIISSTTSTTTDTSITTAIGGGSTVAGESVHKEAAVVLNDAPVVEGACGTDGGLLGVRDEAAAGGAICSSSGNAGGGGGGDAGGAGDIGGSGGGGGVAASVESDDVARALVYVMATSQQYLKPLAAFTRRQAYGNYRGDFLVPRGTALFTSKMETLEVKRGVVYECVQSASSPPSASPPPTPSPSSSSVASPLSQSPPPPPPPPLQARAQPPSPQVRAAMVAASIPDNFFENLLGGRQGEIVCMSVVEPFQFQARPLIVGEHPEELMAEGLNSVGWTKLGVDFKGVLPFSHNKICALSRDPITNFLFQSGRNIMDHAADYLTEGEEKEVAGEG